jgi:hypothetical protein
MVKDKTYLEFVVEDITDWSAKKIHCQYKHGCCFLDGAVLK